jgi:hypothetical protein
VLKPVFSLTVTEPDGSPSVAGVRTLRFTNGTVTDDGSGQVSITIAATTSPGGSTTQIQYNNAGAFGGAAALTYATSGDRLTITSGAATDVPLIVRGHASQSSPLVRLTNSAGSTSQADTFEVMSDRSINLPGQTNAGIFWQKDNTGQPSIRRTGNGILELRSFDGTSLPAVKLSNTEFEYNADQFELAGNYQYRFTVAGTPAGVAEFELAQRVSGLSYARFQIDPSWNHGYWNATDANNARQQFRVAPSWATSTDATRKARVTFSVYDTAAREAWRAEADGAAPMLGFYGSSAVAKQSVSGSRGGNAALADLLTKLATLGLITDGTSA